MAEWLINKKPTMLGAVSGAIAGLVAITPGAGLSRHSHLYGSGLSEESSVSGGVFAQEKFGYDDALDAFGLHGLGGTWGGIATGLFATTSVNADGANGLFTETSVSFGNS
ncbi:hypothetical protein PO124_27160 [Bacillus licheniformis]|nr:hypothetical protein [Bacillus licheniformis]